MDGFGELKPNSQALASAASYKKIKTPASTDDDSGGGGDKDKPNYTKTADPDVHMGKYGVPIKRSEYAAAQADPKNNLKFNTFEDYANWVGGWARKPGDTAPTKDSAPPQTAPIAPSNKAKGTDNTYYPSRNQNSGPSVPSIKSNNY